MANFSRRDAVQFLELAADIPVRTTGEEYRLADANVALRRLRANEFQGAAALRID